MGAAETGPCGDVLDVAADCLASTVITEHFRLRELVYEARNKSRGSHSATIHLAIRDDGVLCFRMEWVGEIFRVRFEPKQLAAPLCPSTALRTRVPIDVQRLRADREIS